MNELLAKVLPQDEGLPVSSSSKYNLTIGILSLITLAGLVAGLNSFFAGHHAVYGNTREVPWGLLLAGYVFFVVTSTGLCLVSSIGHVFGAKNFMPIAKRSVFMAICTILAGFFVIAFEIENPWRMAIYNITSPNLSSNIWWMGTLYGAYLFFMLIEFAMLQVGKHKEATILGLLGVITGIAAHSNLGAVFGLLNAREFWHGPYMPIYFITSAMMSGCAAVIFFTWLAYKSNGWEMSDDMKNSLTSVGKLGLLLMTVIMFFTTWKLISGVSGQPHGKYEAIMALLSGPFAANFWIGEVMLGLVIPFALILAVRAKNMNVMFVAATSGILGILFMRYDLIVVGQLVPHFHGMGVTDLPHLFPYAPTLSEWLVTISGLTLCGIMFLVGEKLFKGHLSEDH